MRFDPAPNTAKCVNTGALGHVQTQAAIGVQNTSVHKDECSNIVGKGSFSPKRCLLMVSSVANKTVAAIKKGTPNASDAEAFQGFFATKIPRNPRAVQATTRADNRSFKKTWVIKSTQIGVKNPTLVINGMGTLFMPTPQRSIAIHRTNPRTACFHTWDVRKALGKSMSKNAVPNANRNHTVRAGGIGAPFVNASFKALTTPAATIHAMPCIFGDMVLSLFLEPIVSQDDFFKKLWCF